MIDYFVTSQIWLSTEDYHNQGITPEEIEKEITKIRHGNLNLSCEPGGINRNWIVNTRATSPSAISLIVLEIQVKLDKLLLEKKRNKPC